MTFLVIRRMLLLHMVKAKALFWAGESDGTEEHTGHTEGLQLIHTSGGWDLNTCSG